MTDSQKSGFMDSLLDAVKPGNVISKVLQFFFFGLVTATPYVVKNLDMVATKVQESGTVGIGAVFAYLKALFGAMWTGVGIGLSTVFDTIINIGDVLDQQKIGTILFVLIVMIFATLMIYQPLRLLFNILDMQKGRQHSRSTIMIISFVVMLVIASPLAHLLTQGDTITSGLSEGDNETVSDVGLNETDFNITGVENGENNNSLVNSLNMLTGG